MLGGPKMRSAGDVYTIPKNVRISYTAGIDNSVA